jgi:hypothetical protein
MTAEPQPALDWLTPETALGARLPCGATVIEAEEHQCADRVLAVRVDFDRPPAHDKHDRRNGWLYTPDGKNYYSGTPDLIPAAQRTEPQPKGVFVTREMLEAAIIQAGLPFGHAELAAALGIAPPPPRPWETAFEAWLEGKWSDAHWPRDIWQGAVEYVLREAEGCGHASYEALRARIMGDA